MTSEPAGLWERFKALEEEIEAELSRRREELRYEIHNRRIVFARDIVAEHRRLKSRLARYILGARASVVLVSPFIYALILPFLLLDLFVSVYQAVCFPVYGMAKVRRGDYLVFDRHHLAYLNGLEKLNCAYCSYANGLLAYVREIAARTEQYWCPIKHAQGVKSPHGHYHTFVDYGDAAQYRARLDELRALLGRQRDDRP